MLPIGDDNVRGGPPAFVTWVLIAINVIIFIYESTLSQASLEAFFQQFAVIPAQVLQGQNLQTLFTSMFLHGGWLHLLGNMLFLWVFGDNIEAALGHFGYLLFYLIGGLAASAAHILFNAGSTLPSLGASGAIAAVLGAYLVMFPHSRIKVLYFIGFFGGITRVTALLFLVVWFVMQLFTGIASLGVPTAQSSGVAYWAHIGGFAVGLLAGLLYRPRAQRMLIGGY